MTKSQRNEVTRIATYAEHLGVDYAARAISALIRAATTNQQRIDLIALADARGWTHSVEFIV